MAKAPVIQLRNRVVLPNTGVLDDDIRCLREAGIPLLSDGRLDEARYEYANVWTTEGRVVTWRRKRRGSA